MAQTPLMMVEGNWPGPTNMAADFDLLKWSEAGRISARTYGWDGPWISLGKFQNPEQDLLPGSNVPHVIRPTGGRAVLHGHDLTIGLAIPLSLIAQPGEAIEKLSRSVRPVYRRTVRPIVLALMDCSVDAALGEEIKAAAQTPKSADCFAHVSANDVIRMSTLQKVCGVAMLLTPHSVLIQASIPIREPLVDPAKVYATPAPVTYIDLEQEPFSAALLDRLKELGS